ncbi:ribosome silencing factor [Alkalihalobacillus sp. AL-G]|uniref:ribosome silencing factor n=1 Tax=Alkalihalobacillus sp. AL-G TaxID=2926399 RepID=UPI00272CF9FD|nr:ribosome silencing factor [Alkalihalobacillus sp. AL-G]WLD92151.1 ribosome silencing factor [Alkalihalobacillus sp. AL-G]
MNTSELVEQSIKALDDKRADNIVGLDVRGISLVADYFLICHGNSEKQVEAIARGVKEVAYEQDVPVKRLEGLEHARWVLIDLGDVIVHIFHKDERSYYNLEKLWGDAPNIDITRLLT